MNSDNSFADFQIVNIEVHEEMIKHYDMVIKDISSEISDIMLERSKAKILVYLRKMKRLWEQSLEQNKARSPTVGLYSDKENDNNDGNEDTSK